MKNHNYGQIFHQCTTCKCIISKTDKFRWNHRAKQIKLPKSVKAYKDKMTLYSSLHYKSGDFILPIYQSKSNVNVLLLSTNHTSVILCGCKSIPEKIRYQSKTKFGVDIIDQMARKYSGRSVRARSFRWPFQVFIIMWI